MSQPQTFLICEAREVGSPELLTAIGKSAPAALLVTGSLLSARREDLLALRRHTAVMTDRLDEISRTNLDGVHIEPPRPVKAERSRFSSLNLGVGGLASRHDAMQAGEEGADYVAFGRLAANAPDEDFAARLELARWWVEVMTTPCVIRVAGPEEWQAAAECGVDFIAARWQDTEEIFKNG